MQMASRVATLSAKAGGRSLLNNINSHLTEAQLEQVNPAVGGASFRLKVISQKDADDAQDMPRRVRSDSDDSKKASRVEGSRGQPEATKLIEQQNRGDLCFHERCWKDDHAGVAGLHEAVDG